MLLDNYNKAKSYVADELIKRDNVAQFNFFIANVLGGNISAQLKEKIENCLKSGQRKEAKKYIRREYEKTNLKQLEEILVFIDNLKDNIMQNRVQNMFAVLEKEHPMTDDVNFNEIVSFYCKIKASIYVISSGTRYDHPHWQVINGIITAAHRIIQAGDHSYRCIILLTSGNNIQGDKLSKLDELGKIYGLTWTNYVSIYFFDENTALCEINPNSLGDLKSN